MMVSFTTFTPAARLGITWPVLVKLPAFRNTALSHDVSLASPIAILMW
jgi:hypothetical protein